MYLTTRRSTDNHGQFITLSVYLCVQHDAREADRRAGPSATADTCLNPIDRTTARINVALPDTIHPNTNSTLYMD